MSYLSLTVCHTLIFDVLLPSLTAPLESQPLYVSDARLPVSLISAWFGWRGWQPGYPGVVLEVPSCEATSPGMTHNSVPLSSCQSRLTEASAGHTAERVTGCLMASLKCERPRD